MRYLAAYLLTKLSGANEVTVDNLSTIITSVGIDFDTERAEKVIADLSGKSVEELIAEGSAKLASVPSGGAAPAAGSASGAAAGGAEEAAPAKEEAEEEEESDDDMGFGLFD
ncbi:60S acidic ribosomal protein P2 [Smittium mucronatum]|uniref:60S acidic ribosomal protein P2 n=1 Tax=Smittium mucronatum TaxID=133383 RepID=A0A1R0GNF7_9FUNG|nr:60S acidic ribosomal protein P2 [Smittium mucronatum]